MPTHSTVSSTPVCTAGSDSGNRTYSDMYFCEVLIADSDLSVSSQPSQSSNIQAHCTTKEYGSDERHAELSSGTDNKLYNLEEDISNSEICDSPESFFMNYLDDHEEVIERESGSDREICHRELDDGDVNVDYTKELENALLELLSDSSDDFSFDGTTRTNSINDPISEEYANNGKEGKEDIYGDSGYREEQEGESHELLFDYCYSSAGDGIVGNMF
jgi:hypothetical protein